MSWPPALEAESLGCRAILGHVSGIATLEAAGVFAKTLLASHLPFALKEGIQRSVGNVVQGDKAISEKEALLRMRVSTAVLR